MIHPFFYLWLIILFQITSLEYANAESMNLECNVARQDSFRKPQIINVKCDDIEGKVCTLTSQGQSDDWQSKFDNNQLLVYAHGISTGFIQSRMLLINTKTGSLTGAIVTFSDDEKREEMERVIGVCSRR